MNKNDDIDQVFDFLKDIRELQLIYRFTPKPDDSYESDAEHSWSVALICMLLATRLEKEFGTKLDNERILKMALVHDLAETKTGDTKTWDKDARKNKEEREREAINELAKKLPADLQREVLSLWEECEAKETLEAKIVKSVDRMDPVIHRTAFSIGWKGTVEDEHATQEALDDRQLPRHSFSKVLTGLYKKVRDEAVSKEMFKRKQD